MPYAKLHYTHHNLIEYHDPDQIASSRKLATLEDVFTLSSVPAGHRMLVPGSIVCSSRAILLPRRCRCPGTELIMR